MVDAVDQKAAGAAPLANLMGRPKGKGTDFAQLIKEQNEIKGEITKKGMAKYAADEQQEKLEKEIREKVLASLGITEEELAKMPASQRALVEKTVQEAIQQEMQARMEEKQQENNKKLGVSIPLVAGLAGAG